MDEMVSEGHLELFFSLVQISVEHLKDGVFGINLSVVILLINLDLLFELLCLGQPQQFSPMSENLHPVEVSHLLLFNHLCLKILLPHLEQLLLLIEVLHGLVEISDSDLSVLHVRAVSLAFNVFA